MFGHFTTLCMKGLRRKPLMRFILSYVYTQVRLCAIWLPFVQLQKCKKHLWRIVTFRKIAGFFAGLFSIRH